MEALAVILFVVMPIMTGIMSISFASEPSSYQGMLFILGVISIFIGVISIGVIVYKIKEALK